jgi:hypothetical protein
LTIVNGEVEYVVNGLGPLGYWDIRRPSPNDVVTVTYRDDVVR